MSLRQISYLLAVAEHGNFTRAAAALHVSQPTLSQQIKHLERRLGVELLDRSSREVRLTDTGAVYARYARMALRELAAGERAVNDVQDLSRGQLRVAATPTFTAYLIAPLMDRFRRAHPGIRLTVSEPNQDRIEADLLADRIDLGIAFAGVHAHGIACRTLFVESLSLLLGAGHRLSEAATVPVAELATENLGVLSADFATRSHIDTYFADCGVRQEVVVEADSVMALLELVRRGSLVAVLPDAIAAEHTDLHRVTLQPAPPSRTVQLLWRDGAYRSAAARAFIATVDEIAAQYLLH